MSTFEVREGKLSPYYNHFQDYFFHDCTATDTRLMGVVALRATWQSKETPDKYLVQLMHLDFSEYGIDEYAEYFFDKNGTKKNVREELEPMWRRISGSLGGKEVDIDYPLMHALIREALTTNEKYAAHHREDIKEFREKTLFRIRQMEEAEATGNGFGAAGSESEAAGNGFSLTDEAMSRVCPKHLTTFETINYFLMRLAEHDLRGAAYLTTLSAEELAALPQLHAEMATLMMNRISTYSVKQREKYLAERKTKPAPHVEGKETFYHLKFIHQAQDLHYYGEAEITIAYPGGDAPKKVTEFHVGFYHKISEYEAALQLRRPEYITVYRCKVPAGALDVERSSFITDAQQTVSPNGVLYLLYMRDNRHVNTPHYFMDQDLYGAYLLTLQDEFILMSRDLSKITMMEYDVEGGILGSELEHVGSYRFEQPIFREFASSRGLRFDDMVLQTEDDDPEDED